jgi:acyl-CoA thioester hydrolase
MARLKLDLPQQFIFTTSISVRVSDINYGGHVGNDSILSIMQEARMKFINHLGYKDEISITDTIGIIVADAAVIYKSESFYGDIMDVKIAIEDISKYGFDMLYQLNNIEKGKEIARGKTGIVCLDYSTRKLATIPTNFLEKLQ